MNSRLHLPASLLGLLVAAAGAVSPSVVRAQNTPALTTLYTFTGGSDGAAPVAGLLQASDGSFYGTTRDRGVNNDGTIFRLTAGGQLTTLYAFNGGNNGRMPEGQLVQGNDGNLYGTASVGAGLASQGTVFRVTTDGAFTALHTFNGNDGGNVVAGLIPGGDGNFYGTTAGGGTVGGGTVFQVTPAGALTTLHSFTGGADGRAPYGPLTRGSDGNFYGTTNIGGANGRGGVFRVTPGGTFMTLHSFTGGSDGAYPFAGLIQAGDGNFYGTTTDYGTATFGTVFRITPAGELTTLHRFTGGSDGAGPYTRLVQGGDGNLYGTTSLGDANNNTLFQITPAGTLTTVYRFSGGNDGTGPSGDLILGRDGNIYGVTVGGGTTGGGTIFRLTVSTGHPAFFNGETALGNGVYFLQLPDSPFGYYSYLSDPHYLYHFDLGYEYVFDANDGQNGVYLYDFTSGSFFYTSTSFPFPYLYDFSLGATLYYFPDTASPGRYTSNPRYFLNTATGKIITK